MGGVLSGKKISGKEVRSLRRLHSKITHLRGRQTCFEREWVKRYGEGQNSRGTLEDTDRRHSRTRRTGQVRIEEIRRGNCRNPLPENSVQVTSKFGQSYLCSFPNQVEAEKKKDEEEKVAMETGISELLRPMETGPCLFKTRDWWSYEFCFGKHIRQFHLEDGKVSGNVIMLGYYESDYNWDNGTEKESKYKARNRLNRYHSQQYVNGSKCDLTGKARRTEVRFVCEEGTGDYIYRLDEPETCSYVMTIHTTKICHHPYLKPPIQNKPVPITCQPIISQLQYDEYLKEEEEKRVQQEKLEEEERLKKEAEAAKLLEGGEPISPAKEGTTPSDPILPHSVKKTDKGRNFEFKDVSDIDPGQTSKIEKLIQGSLKEDFEKLSQQFGGQPFDVKMDVKVVKNMEDLQKAIKDAERQAKGLMKAKIEEGEEEEEEEGQESKDVNEEEEKDLDDDKTLLKFEKKMPKSSTDSEIEKLEKEVDDLQEEVQKEFEKKSVKERQDLQNIMEEFRRSQKNLADLKNNLKETMKGEFDNIVKEAEEETGVEMSDKTEGYSQLTQTLNKLIDKLDKTEKGITEVDKELEELTNKKIKKAKSILDSTEDDIEEDSEDDTSIKSDSTIKSSSSSSSSSLSSSSKSSDDRVKVRVTKLKSGDKIRGGSELSSSSKQTEQLEQDVKEELEKAGLNLGEGKIQVKIITAGYYDDKDESVHILSDEDTSAFKNMIVSILGGDNEASKEEERHNKLEDNYNTVWSSKDKKKSQSILP
ncbi:hypothetical protein FSP39_021483 [Pinctada imbricata]|uniref:Protein OS-9 n=1 Tax=Pinctada imbricata TaxID=66713 RepID=A0AA88YJP6_PINIB|nr:hypothetical protein FSP39_021483 [Pinctada imbricata]